MTMKNLLTGEKGRKILIIGAAAVMMLLLISSLPRKEKTAQPETRQSENAQELERALEKRLEELIGSIEGTGAATVMITLDRTAQQLYVKDEKTETSVRNEENGGTENNVRETETVLAGSAKEPLLSGEVLPRVRGAAVVCKGAADPVIREKVTNTVAKALDIGVSRVYVTY